MLQNQQQTQAQNITGPVYTRPTNEDNTPSASVTQSDPNRFTTYINSIFVARYCENDMVNNGACTTIKMPCLGEFTGTCTGELFFGNYCLCHNYILCDRTYALMRTNDNEAQPMPVSTKKAIASPSFILWSGITDVSFTEAYAMLNHLEHEERTKWANFISVVSKKQGTNVNSTEFAELGKFLNDYASSAIRFLQPYRQIIENLNVLVFVAKDKPAFKKNKFFEGYTEVNVTNAASGGDGNNEPEPLSVLEIPMSKFNLLDQIQLLSYNIHTTVESISQIPNVGVYYNMFVHGIGRPIYNFAQKVSPKLANSYPPETMEYLRKQFGTNVQINLDPLTLCLTPKTNNVTKPLIAVGPLRKIHTQLQINKIKCN